MVPFELTDKLNAHLVVAKDNGSEIPSGVLDGEIGGLVAVFTPAQLCQPRLFLIL